MIMHSSIILLSSLFAGALALGPGDFAVPAPTNHEANIRRHHDRIARATPAIWYSTAATTTIAITTAKASGRCGAAHGTRTVCGTTQTCHKVSSGYSTCAQATRVAIVTTTSKPAATSTSTPAYSGKKKGVSYNTGAFSLLFGSNIGWAYNWFQNPQSTINKNVQFVPMLWDDQAWHLSIWPENVKAAKANSTTHLLGFNEPDLKGQADMTVDEAVANWKKYMEPYAGQFKLVAPAVTNGGAPGGVTFLKSFIDKCTGCHIDAVALHWYDSATNIGYFTNYLNDAAKMFSPRPIWLTEFRGSGTVAQQVSFINTVVPWMEKQSFIERYAIFGLFEGKADEGLMVTNGKLNEVGLAYANAR